MLLRKFLAALVFLQVLISPAQADPLYTVSLLANVDFAPTGMNNAGQMVGFAGGDGGVHAVLYTGGVLQDLGAFGGQSSYANAINDAGAIAGTFVSASGEQHGFVYRDGAMVDIGAGTSANGINAQGDVVGSSQGANGATGFVYRDGTLTALGNLGTGRQGVATSINDVGTIVGDQRRTMRRSARPSIPFNSVTGSCTTWARWATAPSRLPSRSTMPARSQGTAPHRTARMRSSTTRA